MRVIVKTILFLVDQSDIAEDIYLVHKICWLARLLDLLLVLVMMVLDLLLVMVLVNKKLNLHVADLMFSDFSGGFNLSDIVTLRMDMRSFAM